MSDMVLRKGRVFRFGDHVDGKGRKFSLARAEFEAAHPAGSEVPIGFDPIGRGHYSKPHAFEGKLGTASGFAADDTYLDADFALHPLLNDAIEAEGLRMSAIFGVADKRLRRIDVTDRPVLEEAAFFAEDDADEVAIFADPGMFRPHAAAPEDDEGEEELSKEDLAQHMHEVIASGFPGLCDPDHMASFCRGDKSPSHLIAMHDYCLHHGAKCSGSRHATFAEEEYPVAADNEDQDQDQDQPTLDTDALFARLELLEKANKKLSADNARIRAEKLSADSAAFARENADRITPPAQPLFAGLYRALADDDGDDQVVGFAYGKDGAQSFKGSRVDLLRQAVALLTPHGLGVEKTVAKDVKKPAAVEGVVVFSNDEAEAVPADKPAQGAPSADRLAYLQKLYNGN